MKKGHGRSGMEMWVNAVTIHHYCATVIVPELFLFHKDYFIGLYVYECFACLYVCALFVCLESQEARKGQCILWNEVIDVC